MENRYGEVVALMCNGTYPKGMDKSKRRYLKLYSANFQMKGSELFYKKSRRVIRTKEEAMQLFKECHSPAMGGGHLGAMKTRQALSQRYYWYRMMQDIAKWCAECEVCHRVKRPLPAPASLPATKQNSIWHRRKRPLSAPLPADIQSAKYLNLPIVVSPSCVPLPANIQSVERLCFRRVVRPLPAPAPLQNNLQSAGRQDCHRVATPAPLPANIKATKVWDLVVAGFIEPLPRTRHGYEYIFSVVDYYSEWVEAFPLKTKSPAELVEKITDLVYVHSCPKHLVCDEAEFADETIQRLCRRFEIKLTTDYHRQAKGLLLATNAKITSFLRKVACDNEEQWDKYLGRVLFTCREQAHHGTGKTPFMLMFGREALYPRKVPEHYPVPNITLPDAALSQQYTHVKTQKGAARAEDARERQKLSRQGSRLQKRQDVTYGIGDEVLFILGGQGRKGGREEGEFFSGPYIVVGVKGKSVRLGNSEGKWLSGMYSMRDLKPYNEPFSNNLSPDTSESSSEDDNTEVTDSSSEDDNTQVMGSSSEEDNTQVMGSSSEDDNTQVTPPPAQTKLP